MLLAEPVVALPDSDVSSRQDSPSLKRALWSPDNVADSLEFALAGETDAFEQAFRLVHEQYVWRGYMNPDPSGWRLSLFNALPSTKTFVGKAGRRVIGTVTLIPDSSVGLPMDEIYEEELGNLRAHGRRLAEVSALATEPAYRESGIPILMRLVRMLVLYAAEIAKLDDLVVAVNPRHAPFYRRILQFHPLGQLRQYEKVNGAPAVALRLDLQLPRDLIAAARAGNPRPGELYGFLFAPQKFRRIIAQLLLDLPHSTLTPQQFAHFFTGHDVLAKATVEERAYVHSFYEDLSLDHFWERLMAWRSILVGQPRPSLAFATL